MTTKARKAYTPYTQGMEKQMLAFVAMLVSQGESTAKAAVKAGYRSYYAYQQALKAAKEAKEEEKPVAVTAHKKKAEPGLSAEEKVLEYERLFSSGVPGGRAALLAGFPSWADMAIARRAINARAQRMKNA